MNDNGLRHILDLGERGDQRLRVIAVCDVAVGEAHRAKEIVGGCPARLAQLSEFTVHPAVVLGDGLVVVVEHDDEVRPKLADGIQPLERLAARHGAVADQDDDVF